MWGVSQNLASLVNLLPTSWCCSGDRVLSVNGQRVWHHRQASELIRSGTVVVSLLVEKADRDRLPDLSEGLAGGGGWGWGVKAHWTVGVYCKHIG